MNVIAIRHVCFEDLGLLQSFLDTLGFTTTYTNAWELDIPAAESADLVIILGGPISVNDEQEYPFLRDEIRLAQARLRAFKPTLGICLGAQILARAIGGSVGPGPAKEIGWSPLTLTTAGLSSVLSPLQEIPVLHWHGEMCSLPPSTPSLAQTQSCPTQAFIPGQNALALQFHIEAGGDGIEPWLVGHTGEITETPDITVAGLRADTDRYGSALKVAAIEVFRRWFTEVGLTE